MKLPGYMQYDGVIKTEDGWHMQIRIRRWHPSFWIECWRAFRRLRIEITLLGRTIVLQRGAP